MRPASYTGRDCSLSTTSVNRWGAPSMPRAELGIHGLKAGAATGLEKSEKRGVQAARNGPSPPPCVAKPEISQADRLGSRERAAGATHFAAPMSACTRSTFTKAEQASGREK